MLDAPSGASARGRLMLNQHWKMAKESPLTPKVESHSSARPFGELARGPQMLNQRLMPSPRPMPMLRLLLKLLLMLMHSSDSEDTDADTVDTADMVSLIVTGLLFQLLMLDTAIQTAESLAPGRGVYALLK